MYSKKCSTCSLTTKCISLYTQTHKGVGHADIVDIALPRNGSKLAGSIPASVLLYKGLRGV